MCINVTKQNETQIVQRGGGEIMGILRVFIIDNKKAHSYQVGDSTQRALLVGGALLTVEVQDWWVSVCVTPWVLTN